MDKEYEKLDDLEFEYKIAKMTKQSEEIIRYAKARYTKQLNKILRLQKNEEIQDKTHEK